MNIAKEKSPKSVALAELEVERQEDAKNRYKAKLKEIQGAKRVLKNLEREIEDLELELKLDEADVQS